MSTTAIAISAGASAQAAAASAAAHRAEVAACEAFVPTFDSKTATVGQMQQYASCVETLHPQDIDIDDGLIRAVLLVGFASAGFAVFYARCSLNGIGDYALVFIIAFLCGPLILGTFLVLLYGFCWMIGVA